jgi:hypothetical protein
VRVYHSLQASIYTHALFDGVVATHPRLIKAGPVSHVCLVSVEYSCTTEVAIKQTLP